MSVQDGTTNGQSQCGTTPVKNVDAVRHTRHYADNFQKKDEFWEALQPSYDYLMDDGLIASCKEVNGDLSSDEEEKISLTDAVWTYEEFLDRSAELWSWGEVLEAKKTKFESVQQNEVNLFASNLSIFNEQSQQLIQCRSVNAKDIQLRTNALNRLWETLQRCVSAKKHHDYDEKGKVKREISCKLRWLRKWIRGMEIRLGPIYRKADWTLYDIRTKLSHHRVVQKEIESREKNVVTVSKLCQRLEDLQAERKESEGSAVTPVCESGSWFRRDFEHFQRRFHELWLRSLEWQCWLEELLKSNPQLWGSLRDDASSSSSSDEPNRKVPRLNAVLEGSKANQNRRSRTTASVDMVGMAGPVRPTDHHDVGYSSESSAHLSTEDGAGEFVRVYTYTSAEATSPRVLEVVMDGDRRPRKSPVREQSPAKIAAIENEDQKEERHVMQAGSNCGTFYFCHEDSDGDRPCHRQRLPGRKRIIFDADSRSERDDDAEEEEDDDDVLFGDVEDYVDNGHWPDGIHKLVDEAEALVKCSNVNCERVAVDSSCDASGEYTSSSSSSSGGSDVESSSDRRGSVIHLKDRNCHTNGSVASIASESGVKTTVKLRTKKRRNGERPSSFVEASQINFNFKYASFFNSETALNHMKSSRKGGRGGVMEHENLDGRLKRCPRRHLNRNGSLEKEGKCRSLGSLRHSSSSDNGRWKSVGSTIFPKSNEKEMDENTGRGREAAGDDVSLSSSDSTDDIVPARVAEADLTLVQLPDCVSSASEQAWDDFQEGPYFSEPYSEPGVDDEAVRKLMEFGDDYQVYIGSDGASTPSFYSTRGKRPLNNCGFDSESDIEDMNDFLVQNTAMLNATQLQLQKIAVGECPKATLEEVLASVQIHLKCLRTVLEQLLIPLHLSGPGQQHRDRLRLEWEKLVMEATEQEERLVQLGQLRNKARELEERLVETVKEVELWSHKASNAEGVVEEAKQKIQNQLVVLEQLNPSLINLNFQIHDYVTRWSLDVVVLKNQVHILYRSWDQIREIIDKKLNWLEVVGVAWNEYQAEWNNFQSIFNDDRNVFNQLTQAANCSSDLVNVTNSSTTFMTSMIQVLAMKERLLKASSPVTHNSRSALASVTVAGNKLREALNCTGDLSAKVDERLENATKDIEIHETECNLILEQMTTIWNEQDILEHQNLTKSCENVVAPVLNREVVEKSLNVKKKAKNGGGGSLIWRVVRAALPIQLAVMILLCFACLFEPQCCDTLNNFNLSLTPQLRYFDGPPPV